MPGSAALNRGKAAAVRSASCTWSYMCVAAGYYTDRAGHTRAFVSG